MSADVALIEEGWSVSGWLWSMIPGLYLIVCAFLILALYPGLRTLALVWLREQVWAYQRGRWEMDTPAWKREAMEVRRDVLARERERRKAS